MVETVEVLEKTTTFQGYFHIDRYIVRYRRFDGTWSNPVSREIFERGHAVGVLFYDPDRDEVGLIEQFRPGALAAGWQPWLVEIVAGVIDDGETAENVARREATEESGVTITEMMPICRYLVSPGGSSESMALFCARIDSSQCTGFHGLPEESEDIRAFSMPVAEVFQMLDDGLISNGMTLICIQWLALNRDRLRAKWAS
jgi:ADP-ribose pyrophosphatase